MDKVGQTDDEMWDEEDGFFYDVLRLPDGSATRLRIRSMVGLIPLCAVSVIPAGLIERFPSLAARARENYERYADLLGGAADPLKPGVDGRRLLSVLDESKLRKVLSRMLDEERFLSPHGIRSLSRSHAGEPFVFTVHGQEYRVQYLPAESDTAMFGGNSNWRGPVWFPINLLIVRALLTYYLYYGDDFTDRMPHRLGAADDALRGGQGDLRPSHLDLPARRGQPPARLRRDGRPSRTTRTGATCCCSTSTSTATTGRG